MYPASGVIMLRPRAAAKPNGNRNETVTAMRTAEVDVRTPYGQITDSAVHHTRRNPPRSPFDLRPCYRVHSRARGLPHTASPSNTPQPPTQCPYVPIFGFVGQAGRHRARRARPLKVRPERRAGDLGANQAPHTDPSAPSTRGDHPRAFRAPSDAPRTRFCLEVANHSRSAAPNPGRAPYECGTPRSLVVVNSDVQA